MLDTYTRQVVTAALSDLQAQIAPKLTDPASQAGVGMLCRLLANVLVRTEGAQAADATAEAAALVEGEATEDALLARLRSADAGGVVTAEVLTQYLQAWLKDSSITVESFNTSMGGFSKQTFIVKLKGAPQFDNAIVIRRDQVGGPVEAFAADELPIIQLMHALGLPVAAPLWGDKNTPFGGSVLVTKCVQGTTAFDLSASHLDANARAAGLALARVLAQLHKVPAGKVNWLGAAAQDSVQQHVGRMVASFEQQWLRHRDGEVSPLLTAAFAYLKANIPAQSPGPVIVHGDASLRNLLLQGGKATALLDWELWHIGDPTEDLAYSRPDVEQIMPWADFIAEYKAHGGCDYDEKIGAYYGLWGSVRNAVFGYSCMHGFLRAPRPETRMAFGPVYLARKLMPDIARRLKDLGAL